MDEELQATFEKIYQNSINVNKVNNDLKMIIQSFSSKNKGLKDKVASLDQRIEEWTSTNKEFHYMLNKGIISDKRCLEDLNSSPYFLHIRVHYANSSYKEINVEVTLISSIFLLKPLLIVIVYVNLARMELNWRILKLLEDIMQTKSQPGRNIETLNQEGLDTQP